MLLLVTIALVLVAAVTLLIGIISDNLALIFISIGASAVAAIVLAVLSQMSRKKGKSAADGAAAVSPADAQAASAPAPAEPTAATVVADEPTTSMPAVSAPAAAPGGLPIDNYDGLRVNEILPMLDDLDLDELEAVAQYEETHKNRSTVLNRIDARMDVLEDEEAAGGTLSEPADDETVDAAVAAIEDVGQPVMLSDDDEEDIDDEVEVEDDGFPIPGYDDLSESELIPLLDDLDADQLETVADREEAGQNRDGVLDAIDDRLDILEGIVPAPAAAPARKAPAKKVAATKAPATKAPAKKATATRKVAAAPAKRTPAKKAAAPAPAKRTPAKKAAPAKATAPTRKTAVRSAATVKKAAPVKKATAAKKATKKATKR